MIKLVNEKKRNAKKPSLVPTLDNLESIEKNFERVRKEVEKEKDFTKKDFRSVWSKSVCRYNIGCREK